MHYICMNELTVKTCQIGCTPDTLINLRCTVSVLCKVSCLRAFALLKYLKELIVNNCVLGIFTFCLAIVLEGIVIANIVFWDYLRLDI